MIDSPVETNIAAVVDEFIRRLAAGENPDPDELVLAHPENAAELEAQLQAAIHVYQEVRSLPIIGRYRLAAQIGAGSSAKVYRAIDTSSRRTVALKVFPPTPQTDRFDRDVRLLLRLKHPNIAQLLEAGVHDRQPFIALELIEGGSLATRLAAGCRFTSTEAAQLVLRLAEAVHYAHEQRVVHRDIKPGNIMIDASGEPQLTDFGLGRDLDGDPLTHSGQVVGTPLYMAPEQVRGNSNRADARTDVYGLGTVLYELLAGRRPFEPTNPVELARQITEDAPTRPRQINPEIPSTLEAICLRCLQKEPGDRIQTAAHLARELQHWCEGRSQRVWLPSRVGRTRRWWRRQKLWVRRTVQVAGVLAIACGVLGWSAWTLKTRADADRRATVLAEESAALDRRAAALAHEKELLETQARAGADVRAALARGWRALQQGRAGRLKEVRESLATVGQCWTSLSSDEQPGARFEARTLFAMTLAAHDVEFEPGATFTLPPMTQSLWSVAVHPDGKWLALGTRTRPVRLDSGTELPPDLTPPLLGEPDPRLAFSPDGRFLAFSPATGGLQIWDGDLRESGPLIELEPARGSAAVALSFSLDAGVLCACFANGTVTAWRVRDWARRENWTVPAEFGRPTAARFVPAADRVAIGNASGKVSVFTTAGRSEPGPATLGVRTTVQSLAWTPDGGTLAAGFKEGRILVWGTDGSQRELTGWFPNGVGFLEYSPDGNVLGAAHALSESVFWDRMGRVVLRGSFAAVGFSRNGRTVATTGSTRVGIGRWVVPNVIRTLRGHERAVGKIVSTADGTRLVSVDMGFQAWVWDVASARPVASFPLPVGAFYPMNAGLAISGDGRFVAYASGGRDKAAVLIRDLAMGRDSGPWELPGGFDHLVAIGGDRFRLVREEFVGGSEVLESVLYDLDPVSGPQRVRVIRPASATDTRRYFDGLLTTDGRYYAWCGPRQPRALARLEVFDLENRRMIHARALPQPYSNDPGFGADPSNRGIRLMTPTPGEPKFVLLKFPPDPESPIQEEPIVDLELEMRVINSWVTRLRSRQIPVGRTPLIGLCPSNFVPDDAIGSTFLFQDGRKLAWTDRTGAIMLTDRALLFQAVAEFERTTFR